MLRHISSSSALRAKSSVAGGYIAPALAKRSLVSSVLLSSTRDGYESKRIVELKQELKARGLSSSGKKDDLIKRLVESDSVRAGSNAHKQPSDATRAKSTLASLRSKDSTNVSEEGKKAAEETAEAVAKAGSPLGSLKKSETPASLEAGTVHNAAADGLDASQNAKSSPTPAPEGPAITTSPPGLPPQKAPQPKETFNVQIPYYEDAPEQETYIPIFTSYTSPHVTTQNQAQDNGSSGPKVISVSATSTFSGEGVSHNADLSGSDSDAPSSDKGFLREFLSGFPGADAVTQNIPGSKALQSLKDQASSALNQATAQLAATAGSSSSSSGSSSGSIRNANRALTDEERTGAWVLLGIVAGGFVLGGLGKSSASKEAAAHESKAESVAVKATPPSAKSGKTAEAQPTGSSIATPAGSSVKAPIMCVPKGSTVASAPVGIAAGLSDSTLAQIARLSTCEVSDALIKLKLPHGGHLPGIEVYSPQHLEGDTKICGPAFTVKMVSQQEKDAPKPDKHFVDAAPAQSVMVVTAPANNRSAVWGGLMTARAQFLGVQGVILDGRCRDLSEHREAKFPVFARGHSTLGQSPFTRPSELQVPITIVDPTLASDSDRATGPKFPSLTVNPGDIVLADMDGVVVIPPCLAEKVIAIANKGRDEDAKCMEDLKRGKGVKETFAKHRSK